MQGIRFLVPTFSLIMLATLLIGACTAPIGSDSMGSSAKSGSLAITIGNNVNSRTLTPNLDMNVASYTITGTGPASAGFTITSASGSITQNSLAFGTWAIVVNATNAGGTLIGTGTGTAQITSGATTLVSISVTPVTGKGSLALNVSWPAAQVQTPSICASLTPALGAAQSLPFVINGGTANYSSSEVGNGYYTLAFSLKDNNIAVAGAVEVVRIVTGQTTNGTYAFSNVNAPGGNIQVNIDFKPQNPLDVTITGASPTLAQGSTEILTASTANYAGNVVYVWYVNGLAVGTGATYTFGANTTVGYHYRIDVTAFTADGTQAGSATANLDTIAAIPTPTPIPDVSWTARTLPSNQTWTSVTYGNGTFVAIAGSNGMAASSTDGVVWTARSLPAAQFWSAVTYGNGIFVAVAFGGTMTATSPDGITWTARPLEAMTWLQSVTYGNGTFVAVTANNSSVALTSPDGITWTTRTLPSSENWSSVTYGNGTFVAVAMTGNTVAATSPDGITWTARNLPISVNSETWSSVTYGNGTFVAVSSTNYFAASSPDGITWTARTLPSYPGYQEFVSVTYGNGTFVAVSQVNAIVASSADGITWTSRILPSNQIWSSVCYGNGIFVAVAWYSSVVLTSP